MSVVKARNFVISAGNEKSVTVNINTPTTSYTINLPTEPPEENTALFYDGFAYKWQPVAQSVPASDIPTGYEDYQVFNTNVLLQAPEITISPPDAPKVRMMVDGNGTVFFQKYDETQEEWIGAVVSLDAS